MKIYFNIIVLLIFCFLSNNYIGAQSVGVRLAPNYSYFSFSKEIRDSKDRKNVPDFGFDLGAFCTFRISEKIQLEQMVNFTKYGTTIDLKDEITGKHSFYNLQFPLIIKYIISINNQPKVSIFSGTNLGLGLGRPTLKFCTHSGCETLETSYSSNEEYGYQQWTYGAVLGAQYNLIKKIKIDIRYLKNFSNLYNSSYIYKSNTISIGLSYTCF